MYIFKVKDLYEFLNHSTSAVWYIVNTANKCLIIIDFLKKTMQLFVIKEEGYSLQAMYTKAPPSLSWKTKYFYNIDVVCNIGGNRWGGFHDMLPLSR
jgi:hypothetical protein